MEEAEGAFFVALRLLTKRSAYLLLHLQSFAQLWKRYSFHSGFYFWITLQTKLFRNL